jgi:GxxExxY protein
MPGNPLVRFDEGRVGRTSVSPSLLLYREIVFQCMTENEVARQIVDAAFRVHASLGPGLLESVYEVVLAYELETRGLRVARQQPVPIVYQGTRIEIGFRAGLIIEDRVIVEIKSVEAIAAVHKEQLLTDLRLADKRLGLLINFHVALIQEGITRIANGMPD